MARWILCRRTDGLPSARQAESEGTAAAMTGSPSTQGRHRPAAITVLAAALGLLGTSLMGAPAAFAESTVSPTGMVVVSVPPPVVAGVASTYTMTVTNTTSSPFDGPAGVVVFGEMPSGITIHGITGCTNLGGNQSTSVNCAMPNLAPGASETATFSMLASAVGDYQITFGAAAAVQDPACSGCQISVGDSATLTVTAQAGPTDIQVTGSSNNGSPRVGSTFTYTFQVKNNGPLPAAGVTLDDPLPATILLGSTLTIDNGTCTANTAAGSVHCDIGDLAIGQQSTITFTATPTAAGAFGNTATIAMNGTDTHPANNGVTVTVQPR